MRKQHQPEVFRITGARQSLQEDVRGRQRRYVISMLIRTVAVLLTVVLWNVERPLAVVTLVLGLTLPYIAVVIANAGRENAPSAPPTVPPDPMHQELEPSRVSKAEDETGTARAETGTAEGETAPEEAESAPNETTGDRS
ncbi:DUF3099 domain-containing protein [Streptomyces sp. 891-h]|uniref:DUF3099 domain-containing protein n=1 Tax=Streptomyces sp. 891-h TaxID=2720714 RepID=UPI001FAA380E|nr:DUF3099 domain-containing protein [Streptomyces sp. 891-h]UNZ22128.1 DUF3099 domain-containing protein [Streptomyces sp. 891-h]